MKKIEKPKKNKNVGRMLTFGRGIVMPSSVDHVRVVIQGILIEIWVLLQKL